MDTSNWPGSYEKSEFSGQVDMCINHDETNELDMCMSIRREPPKT